MDLADGATRIFGIIGDPIAQVRSPIVFNERFRRLRINAIMIALHTKPERFDDSMLGLKSISNFDRLLVTLPYKNRVMSHVDDIFPAAKRIGAINALRRAKDGRWSGDMFDPRLFVVDVLPEPEITPLLALAKSSGCKTINGQAMVAGQAGEILRFVGPVSADER